MNVLPLKMYETVIEHNAETVVVAANGGRKTILKIVGRAGKLKQFSYRTTQLGTFLKIGVDGLYAIEFPSATQIITNHTMTSSYAPECYFSSKSGASPYSLTSTYEIDFTKSIEIIIVNTSATAANITDAFLVANLFTPEYEKEKAWFD